jgi:glycosyltransferase involved in cell wall biosynthesis
MKVAHVIVGGDVAGGQIVCDRLLRALRARGDESLVISPTEGDFTEQLKARDVPVHIVSSKRTYHFQAAWHIAHILKREYVDLVHTHAMMLGNVHARFGARLAGVPVVSHLHIANQFNARAPIRAYQRFLDNRSARLCRGLIAVSEATRSEFVSQGVPRDRIKVIYNGIDPAATRPTRSRDEVCCEFDLEPQRHQLIGMVGRLCDIKGQKEFLMALTQVGKRFPNAIFFIVGKDMEANGAYEQELKALTQKLELNKRVVFTGYRQDVADLVNAFEFVVLPSKQEGFPLAILEAMALKKAVIATHVDGVPEVVADGVTGILVPRGNVLALENAIGLLLADPERVKRFGELGYERVCNEFSEQEMVRSVLNVYDEVSHL